MRQARCGPRNSHRCRPAATTLRERPRRSHSLPNGGRTAVTGSGLGVTPQTDLSPAAQDAFKAQAAVQLRKDPRRMPVGYLLFLLLTLRARFSKVTQPSTGRNSTRTSRDARRWSKLLSRPTEAAIRRSSRFSNAAEIAYCKVNR